MSLSLITDASSFNEIPVPLQNGLVSRRIHIKFEFESMLHSHNSVFLCILLGISPAADCGLPTFRNTLSVPSSLEDGTDRGFRNVGKPQSDAGEIPKRIHTRFKEPDYVNLEYHAFRTKWGKNPPCL